jgi:hypothetical protein
MRDALRVHVDRLVTYATLRQRTATAHSVGLRHVARLADGREILLLDDRGFGGSGPAGAFPTLEEVELSARTCAGPDEPADGLTREQMDASHWALIVERLQAAGVTVSVDEVSHLEHDVALDDRLRAAVA